MTTISLLSTLAMAVGLAASLPQILRMLRTRSSAGQSVLGWAMGLVTNLSMAYVNLFGFGAAALMASNVLSAVLCVAAIVLILRFGAVAEPFVTPLSRLHALPTPALHASMADLPTTEFAAIEAAVHTISQHRAAHERRGARGCAAEPREALARVA